MVVDCAIRDPFFNFTVPIPVYVSDDIPIVTEFINAVLIPAFGVNQI